MSADHPHHISPEALRRFATKDSDEREARRIMRHLLGGCDACRDALRALGGYNGLRHGHVGDAGYDAAFAKASAAVEDALARLNASPLLAQLDAIPAEQRELKVRNLRRFASPPLSRLLVERSEAARFTDTRKMLLDARLAVAAAEAAAARRGLSEELVNDALARAWGALANAYRLRSELPAAEHAFAAAFRYLDQGSGDQRLRAWLCRHLASLHLFRREFEEAVTRAEEAAALYHLIHDYSGEAGAVITVAVAHIYSGAPYLAIDLLEKAEVLARRSGDTKPFLAAVANRGRAYLDLGLKYDAQELYVDHEECFELCEDRTTVLKWLWLGAQIERDMGLLYPAAMHFERLRDAFLDLGLRVEAADISLELTEVYLRRGDVPGVMRTVAEAIPIYSSLGATRELLASFLQLGKVAHQRAKAAALFERLARQLRESLRRDGG